MGIQAPNLMPEGNARASTEIDVTSTVTNHTLSSGITFARVINDADSSSKVYVQFSTGATTSNNGYSDIIEAGGIRDYSVGSTTDISFITASSTATINVIEK